MTDDKPEKTGAGLLLCRDGQVLLLKRSEQCGNPGTWGLPGGNMDPGEEGDLLETAKREACEEIGSVPDGLVVKSHHLTKRGKRLQKHYTVYVCGLPSTTTSSGAPPFVPTLNEEHTEYRWFAVHDVLSPHSAPTVALHPVLCALRGQHEDALHALVQEAPAH